MGTAQATSPATRKAQALFKGAAAPHFNSTGAIWEHGPCFARSLDFPEDARNLDFCFCGAPDF